MKLVFLCGARDFHAMDWYRSAQEILPPNKISILTDLIAGEGYKKIVNNSDNVDNLIIIDKFLFNKQSSLGNIWRNILKFLLIPFQVFLIKRFNKKNPDSIYFAHSMYYLWLAYFSNVKYIGTPQGSDILVKPFKSRLYKYISIKSLKAALFVTVDSILMKDIIYQISGIKSYIIQNGIDLKTINSIIDSKNKLKRNKILSHRGISPIYRIENILISRNKEKKKHPISFIYPFYENDYKKKAFSNMRDYDNDLGRVDRISMYNLFFETNLVLSIPYSDSSPRSVYEAIFCGCVVGITYQPYYNLLPLCMKKRIILINLKEKNWLDSAYERSKIILKYNYYPSRKAIKLFDQRISFKKIYNLINKIYEIK